MFEDFFLYIQDLTPKNGGDFASKLPAWNTSLHTLSSRTFSTKKDWVESRAKIKRRESLATIFCDGVMRMKAVPC